MLITPIQLVDEPLVFDETIAPGALEYTPDLKQVGPMEVKGQADLIVEHRGAIPSEDLLDSLILATHPEICRALSLKKPTRKTDALFDSIRTEIDLIERDALWRGKVLCGRLAARPRQRKGDDERARSCEKVAARRRI